MKSVEWIKSWWWSCQPHGWRWMPRTVCYVLMEEAAHSVQHSRMSSFEAVLKCHFVVYWLEYIKGHYDFSYSLIQIMISIKVVNAHSVYTCTVHVHVCIWCRHFFFFFFCWSTGHHAVGVSLYFEVVQI